MRLMNVAGPKIMLLVLKRIFSSPLTRTIVCAASRLKSVSIHGPIGLKVSAFLARHKVRSPAGQVLRFASDDCDELGLVLHALGRIGGNDDRLAMRGQRIVGTIADIGGVG